jgi:hypothetical protein
VFYRQHNPASRQEKAVATSLHFMGMFASRPMEGDYTLFNRAPARSRGRFSFSFSLATTKDRGTRARTSTIGETKTLWSPSLKISAKT